MVKDNPMKHNTNRLSEVRCGQAHPLLHWLGRFVFWLTGWKAQGPVPPYPKYVAIFGPHTSYWDLPVSMMMTFVLGIAGNWMGKHTVFFWPLGWVLRRVGGIPIERSSHYDTVQQVVDIFNRRERLILALAPEATTHKTSYWKSGFYHIALRANVPVVLGFFDYKRKVCGNGGTIYLTGDVEADLAKIRDFYATVTPRFPEKRSEVRFREQDGK